MSLTRVTITGADDATDIPALWALWRDFPFVEFALLWSHDRAKPKPRWPSRAWLDRLVTYARAEGRGPDFALHLCGEDLASLLRGDEELLCDSGGVPPGLWQLCRRVQLNTHGEPVDDWRPGPFAELWANRFPLCRIIQQIDGGHGATLMSQMQTEGVDVQPLFDLSHGAGVLPPHWPGARGVSGYAGGLGPDNLVAQLQRIDHAARGNPYWIDMETKVRSAPPYAGGAVDFPDVLDLDLAVRQVLTLSAPHVQRT